MRGLSASLVALSLMAPSCQQPQDAATKPSPSPTPPSPTASPTPTPSPSVGVLEQVFARTEDFTFSDVPRSLERAAVSPIELAVGKKGRILDRLVRSVEGTEATATLAAIEPRGSATDMTLFAQIIRTAVEGARQAGGSGQVSRAAGGQAFKVDAGDVESLFTPVAVKPYLLLLNVTGPATEDNEDIVRAILEANSE